MKIKAKDKKREKKKSKALNTVTAETWRITVKNGTFSSPTISKEKIGM